MSGFLHEGVWLPAGERHLVGMMSPTAKRFARLPDGRATYQRHKYLAALAHVAQPDTFVDVGAHVGLWSMQAAEDFREIVAFEPVEVHAQLFTMNVARARLYRCALGDGEKSVALTSAPTSSGDTYVSGPGDIPMKPLDDFTFERIDLLKIDTEGFELPICKGGTRTILEHKPVIVVEQKGRDARYHGGRDGEAVAYLKNLGFDDLCKPISGDHIMGWSG